MLLLLPFEDKSLPKPLLLSLLPGALLLLLLLLLNPAVGGVLLPLPKPVFLSILPGVLLPTTTFEDDPNVRDCWLVDDDDCCD